MISLPSSSKSIKIPNNNDFDQETAKYLLKTCACLIVEDFPRGSEFGIDLSIHYTGENFMGLKMIPPGLHFIYFSMVNKQGSVAPRTGFFHYFHTGQILVTKWDPSMEDIVLDRQDNDQIERIKDSFKKGYLDTKLGAYQFDRYQTWVSLTDYVSEELFHKLNPLCGKIFSVSDLVYKKNEDGTMSNEVDQFGLPEMVVEPETAIRFVSKLPKRFIYPNDATPNDITYHSIDSTYTLEQLLTVYHDNQKSSLLGELQFVFIVFLLGHVFEAFEFWRDLLKILCNARKALTRHTDLYLAFIRVVHFQLKQTNEAIYTDIVENENQVYHFMRIFMVNIRLECDSVEEELVNRSQKFANVLAKSFKWKFDYDDEPEDERPVIVTD